MTIRRIMLLGALAVLAGVFALALLLPVGVYNGLNKGVTVGNCGFEIVGEPGFFCGDY